MTSSSIPLSVNLMPTAPVQELVELARIAEREGCNSCWAYDEGLVTRDVYLTLGAIASATSHLRVGPGITNPYVRHPGATAAAIATLDELSGGRAFVGLGAGGALTLGPLAIERSQPLTTVTDTVAALRALFAGERVEQHNTTFSFDNATLSFARPDIDIILAGRGPKMMRLARDRADGFYLSYIHKELLGDAVARVRPADRPFRLVYSTMVATTDEEVEAARAQLTFRLVDSPSDVRDRLDISADHIERIRSALRSGGPTAAAEHIDPDWVEYFVITGSSAACAAELHSLLDRYDIDEFLLAVGDPSTGAELIERTAALFRNPPEDD